MNKKTSKKYPEEKNTHYSFTLFTIKDGENSAHAKKNLKKLCEKLIPDRYSIKIVDVIEDFQTALDQDILITPTVVITKPKPRTVIHGDLSNHKKFENVINYYEEEVNGG